MSTLDDFHGLILTFEICACCIILVHDMVKIFSFRVISARFITESENFSVTNSLVITLERIIIS